jgi:hypothetical protein
MLQGRHLSPEDVFRGLEGCNGILNDSGWPSSRTP